MTHHNINLLIISLVRKNKYVLYHLYYSYIVFNVVGLDGFIPIIRVLAILVSGFVYFTFRVVLLDNKW